MITSRCRAVPSSSRRCRRSRSCDADPLRLSPFPTARIRGTGSWVEGEGIGPGIERPTEPSPGSSDRRPGAGSPDGTAPPSPRRTCSGVGGWGPLRPLILLSRPTDEATGVRLPSARGLYGMCAEGLVLLACRWRCKMTPRSSASKMTATGEAVGTGTGAAGPIAMSSS